jgi:prepilin-type processing-associated H-X9-DG protein
MKALGARGQIEEPSETFLVFDGARYRVLDSPSTGNPLADIKSCIGYDRTDSSRGHRHNDMLNVTYCDGHVKTVQKNVMVDGVPISNTGVTETPWNIRW